MLFATHVSDLKPLNIISSYRTWPKQTAWTYGAYGLPRTNSPPVCPWQWMVGNYEMSLFGGAKNYMFRGFMNCYPPTNQRIPRFRKENHLQRVFWERPIPGKHRNSYHLFQATGLLTFRGFKLMEMSSNGCFPGILFVVTTIFAPNFPEKVWQMDMSPLFLTSQPKR